MSPTAARDVPAPSPSGSPSIIGEPLTLETTSTNLASLADFIGGAIPGQGECEAICKRAFNLHVPRCNYHNNKGRSCVDHPKCVERAKSGMKSAPFWRSISLQVSELGDVVPAITEAVPGVPRGLRNLGATCFFNVFVQCLFWNTMFRQIVYDHEATVDSGDYDQTVLVELKVLFTCLQVSSSSTIDPTRLVTLLGLRICHQQDVQEFTHLFLTFLQSGLSSSATPSCRQFITQQFEGRFVHKTTCLRCHKASVRRSSFTELCLPVTKQVFAIETCLALYLHSERLSGNNRYNCGVCNDKCNADRSLELEHIPPILHIQLMRFVYNRKSQTKVKLHIAVDIPLVLTFQNAEAQDLVVYDLTAVILHTGESTHSGHYIAEIRDELSGQWTRFNDGDVSPGHLVSGSSTRYISSDTAYMLVYAKRGRLLERFPEPPMQMKLFVKERDALQKATHLASINRQQDLINRITLRRSQIATFWERCLPAPDDKFNIIEQQWLVDWLRGERGDSGSYPDGRIINAALLCSDHQRVDPRRIGDFFFISTSAWEYLVSLCGCDISLNQSQLCSACALALSQPTLLSAGSHEKPPESKRPRMEEHICTPEILTRLRQIYKRARPFPSSQPPTLDRFYLVRYCWISSMNNWLKIKSDSVYPGPIMPGDLLCPHGGAHVVNIPCEVGVTPALAPAKSMDASSFSQPLMALPSEDWDYIESIFSCVGGPVIISFANLDTSRQRLARQWMAVTSSLDPPPCSNPECVDNLRKARDVILSGDSSFQPSTNDSDSGLVLVQRAEHGTASISARRAASWLQVMTSWRLSRLKEELQDRLGINIGEQVLHLIVDGNACELEGDSRTLSDLNVPLGSTISVRSKALNPLTDFEDTSEGFYGTRLFKSVSAIMERVSQQPIQEERSSGNYVPVMVNPFFAIKAETSEEKLRARSLFPALIRARGFLRRPEINIK